MRTPLRLVVASASICVGFAFAVAAQDRTSRVTFQTPDGQTIVATMMEPSRRPAPAIILVHMLGRSRKDWEQAAARLANEGFTTLAIDLRGHGESSSSGGGADERASLTAMVTDVRTAKRFLDTRADVLPGRIGIAGASFGATLAALAAGDDATIRSIVLLSAAIDYRGVRIEAAMKKYGQRRALFIASREDPYAWRSMRELTKDAPAREMVLLDRAGHGTAMLADNESLIRTLVDWFRRTLI
ncbi:MAG TPA: alpha/beta fold hydrolase [Vicinamibacterales bacterium]